MRILITGSSSFVAKNLSKYLKLQGNILYGLGRSKTSNPAYEKEYDWNQINDLPWEEIEAVVHLAAKVHDTANKASYEEFYDVNVGLTTKLFDSFLLSNASKFIFLSSIAVVGNVKKGEIINEDSCPNPTSNYGKTKLEAEKYLRDKRWDNKKVYIFRPSMIYGEGNKGNLNLLYNLMKKGIPYPLGKFDNKRSFVSVENLDFTISETLKKDIASGVYNISDDKPFSTKEIIKMIAEALNKNEIVWNIPESLIRLIGKAGDIFHLPLNTNRLSKLTEDYLVSNQKIKKALLLDEFPYSTRESMKKTIEYLRDN